MHTSYTHMRTVRHYTFILHSKHTHKIVGYLSREIGEEVWNLRRRCAHVERQRTVGHGHAAILTCFWCVTCTYTCMHMNVYAHRRTRQVCLVSFEDKSIIVMLRHNDLFRVGYTCTCLSTWIHAYTFHTQTNTRRSISSRPMTVIVKPPWPAVGASCTMACIRYIYIYIYTHTHIQICQRIKHENFWRNMWVCMYIYA